METLIRGKENQSCKVSNFNLILFKQSDKGGRRIVKLKNYSPLEENKSSRTFIAIIVFITLSFDGQTQGPTISIQSKGGGGFLISIVWKPT